MSRIWARIGDNHEDPGGRLHIDEPDLLHLLGEHDEPGHHRAVRGVVEPAIVVRVCVDSRLAEFVDLERAGMAMAPDHEQPAGVVGLELTQGVDRVWREPGRESRGIGAAAVAAELRLSLVPGIHGARPRIDDQPLTGLRVGDVGVAHVDACRNSRVPRRAA